MTVIDVEWTPFLNVLSIKCDCGLTWRMWANVSVIRCPNCGRLERWHGIDPEFETGPWSAPQMKIEL